MPRSSRPSSSRDARRSTRLRRWPFPTWRAAGSVSAWRPRRLGERIAPLPPGEARVAEGHDVRGSLSGAGKGAVAGGILGAIGGAISGAIQGSIYHPEGSYEMLAMLLTEYSSGRTLPERATIAPVE